MEDLFGLGRWFGLRLLHRHQLQFPIPRSVSLGPLVPAAATESCGARTLSAPVAGPNESPAGSPVTASFRTPSAPKCPQRTREAGFALGRGIPESQQRRVGALLEAIWGAAVVGLERHVPLHAHTVPTTPDDRPNSAGACYWQDGWPHDSPFLASRASLVVGFRLLGRLLHPLDQLHRRITGSWRTWLGGSPSSSRERKPGLYHHRVRDIGWRLREARSRTTRQQWWTKKN